MNIEIVVPGIPEPKGSHHIQRRGNASWLLAGGNAKAHERLKDWEARVRTYAAATMRALGASEPLAGPIALDVTFYLPRPHSAAKRLFPAVKPDLSKLVRGVEDPLSDLVYDDDARIVSESSRKVYADPENPPGASIRVWTV